MRPVLVDEADGPCEICADWAARKRTEAGRHCDACGVAIPVLLNMFGNGYDSVRPHHFHLRGIGPSGTPGRAAVHRELCTDCYRLDFAAAYPGATVPV